jgi:hypothetical protein
MRSLLFRQKAPCDIANLIESSKGPRGNAASDERLANEGRRNEGYASPTTPATRPAILRAAVGEIASRQLATGEGQE